MLLSGGLDSFTAAAMTRADGYELYALSIRYGQVHAREIEAARAAARALGVARHLELASTSLPSAVPRSSATVRSRRIVRSRATTASRRPTCPRATRCFCRSRWPGPKSWAPTAIVIGVNALDYSGYPDCRPEYLEAFERMAALATKAGVEGRPLQILAPLLHLSKADIIRRGVALGLDYGLTHSCYDPAASGAPCGRCDSCRLRAKGFAEAGIADPLTGAQIAP